MGSSNADAIVLSSDDSDDNSLGIDSADEQPAEQLQLRGIYCVFHVLAYFLPKMIPYFYVLLQDLNTRAAQTLISSVCLETTCI